MEVNVVHTLSCTLAAICNNTEAVVETELLCKLCRNLKNVSDKSRVALVNLSRRLDVLLGDNEYMCGCLRVKVLES